MRLSPPLRGSTEEESTAALGADTDERSAGSGLLRKLLAAGAVFGGAYAVSRWLSSGETAPSVDEVRQKATAAVPDGVAEGPGPATGGESAGDEPEADLPGESRSDEEITERAQEEVQETPAEPGEMNVDEDVVEDIVDEAIEGEGGTESDEAIEDDPREMAEEAADEHIDPAERSSDDTVEESD